MKHLLKNAPPHLLRQLFAAVVIMLIISCGYFYYQYKRHTEIGGAEAELALVADLHAGRLATWFQRRLADAAVIQQAARLSDELPTAVTSPVGAPFSARVTSWLDSLRREYNYTSITLYDAQKVARLTVPENYQENPAKISEDLAAALKTQVVRLADLHQDTPGSPPHMNLFVPLGRRADGLPLGVIVLNINPEQHIYPIIKSWPEPRRTAETMLIRREGAEVVFLSPLRHQTNGALQFRLPLTRTDFFAVRAALGYAGVTRGLDYRGVPVCAAACKIPNLSWTLIAKIDEAEILAPLRHDAWQVSGLAAVLVSLVIAGMRTLGRREQLQFVQRELELERRKVAAEARFQRIFEYSPVPIWKEDFSAVQARFLALRATGVKDFRRYLDEHPEEVRNLGALVKTVNMNAAARQFMGLAAAPMVAGLPSRFDRDESPAVFKEQLIVLAAGGRFFESQVIMLTPSGERRHMQLTVAVPEADAGKFDLVLASVFDLTEIHMREQEISRLNRLLAALSQINQAVVRVRTRSDLFEEVCQALVHHGQFKMAWVGWADPATRQVQVVAACGDQSGYLKEIRVFTDDRPEGRGTTGTCIRENRSYICNDFSTDPNTVLWRALAARHGFAASISVPIRRAGQAVGAVMLYATERNFFGPGEIALMEEAGSDISFALEHLEAEARRAAAEAALAESAGQLKEAQRIAKLGTYVLDIASGIWSSSDLLDSIFGIAPDYDRSVAGWLNLIHPDDRELMADYFQNEVLTGKTSFNKEYRIRRHRDQAERWVQGFGQVEFDAEGRPEKMIGTIQDITKNKKAMEMMVASEIRYRRLFESAKDGILILDAATGMVVDVNPFLATLLGYSPAEFLDKKVWELSFFKDLMANEAKFTELQAKEYVRYENLALETRDGRRIEVEFISNLYWVNDHKVIQCNIRDITERVQAELVNAHLAAIVESSADAIVGKDLNGIIQTWNQGAEKLFGYAASEMIGQSVQGLIPPEIKAEEAALLGKIQAGDLVQRYETVRLTKSGQPISVSITISPIKDGRGQITGFSVVARDITERKQAEEKLRAAMRFLQSTMDAIPQQICVLDPKGDILATNRAWKSFEPESLNHHCRFGPGDNYLAVCDRTTGPEAVDAQAFAAGIRAVSSGQQEFFSMEYPCHSPTEERWFAGSVARFGEAIPARVVVCHENITERKQAEEMLRLRLSLIEYAAEHSLGELLQKTLDEVGAMVNSPIGFYHFVGADQKTIMPGTWSTQTLQKFCKAAGQQGHQYHLDQAGVWADCVRERRAIIHNDYATLPNQKGMPPGHAQLIRELVVPIFRQDKVVAVLGVGNKAKDYTQKDLEIVTFLADVAWEIVIHKRAEEIRARLATAVEQADETIVITDTAGTILYANPAFEKSTGYTCAEVLGGNPRVLKSGKHDAAFYREMWETLKQGGVWHGHFSNKRKDGALYEEEATISPIHDTAGNITSFVAVKRDVTHEVEMESQLRQSQKMQAMGTLAGGIAHDFNNILTIMFGYCNLLQLDLAGNAESMSKLGEIMKAGERAKDLVQQILTFSRQREQERQVIHLDGIIKEAMKLLRASLPTNIQIEASLSPATPTVLADATQIYQVMMNLGTNALHALEGRAGQLTVKLDAFRPDEKLRQLHPDLRDIEYARLIVADTGHGMNASTMERIFEPFFTTKPVGKGTGLGLAVVHGIMEAHDGVITVESQPEVGTTFTLYFPEQIQDMFLTGIPDRKIPCGKGQQILVVDDEEALTKMYQRLLKALRYECVATNRPKEAVARVREKPAQFDLVITDLTMPDMNGLEVARQIHAVRADLPVILATGFKGTVTDRQLHDAGICELVEKPISLTAIAGVLQKLLGKK